MHNDPTSNLTEPGILPAQHVDGSIHNLRWDIPTQIWDDPTCNLTEWDIPTQDMGYSQ